MVNHKFVFSKKDGIEKFLIACDEQSHGSKLINAFVGFDGLVPSVMALKLGFDLALANKEPDKAHTYVTGAPDVGLPSNAPVPQAKAIVRYISHPQHNPSAPQKSAPDKWSQAD